MITGFFLNIGLTLITYFVNLLPVRPFPTEIAGAITAIVGYMNAFSFIFPVGTLLTVLGLALTFHLTVILWNFSHLVLRYLRGR